MQIAAAMRVQEHVQVGLTDRYLSPVSCSHSKLPNDVGVTANRAPSATRASIALHHVRSAVGSTMERAAGGKRSSAAASGTVRAIRSLPAAGGSGTPSGT